MKVVTEVKLKQTFSKCHQNFHSCTFKYHILEHFHFHDKQNWEEFICVFSTTHLNYFVYKPSNLVYIITRANKKYFHGERDAQTLFCYIFLFIISGQEKYFYALKKHFHTIFTQKYIFYFLSYFIIGN